MPQPLLYLQAMGAAAIVSAVFVLAMAGRQRVPNATWVNAACALGISLGLACGYAVLGWQWNWPPANGLDRFLTIVMPATLGVELLVGLSRGGSGRAGWFLRCSLAAVIPRILLHDSVYLNEWSVWQTAAILVVCSGGLIAHGWLLLTLSQRWHGASIPVALALAIPCAGLTVMMAGYLQGGVAAFPLAATIFATALGSGLVTQRAGAPISFSPPVITIVGVVGLFGLVLIGFFFGRLSTGTALTLLFAPLLCWVTELPRLSYRNSWALWSFRLVLVAIPLVVLLALAKRDFDRRLAPLLHSTPHGIGRLLIATAFMR